MNLDQWDKLHKRCAPQLEVSYPRVSDWLWKAPPDEVMRLIVTMKKAQTDKDAFQEYCDWLVAEVGGYQ